ncbi:MAG: hypothetical protein H0Z34_16840 [Brevibacillus sp.]|nr:hypothetical protein [Brevibacillus sp.]
MVKYLLGWLLAYSLLYLPLSLLSGQPLSFASVLIWVSGHVVYTAYLAVQLEAAALMPENWH